MINIVSIKEIINGNIKTNSEIIVRGWVKTRRNSKSGISFISVYDGSSLHVIQVIAHISLINYKSEILSITSGCSVIITGNLIYSPGDLQKFEIQATLIKVLGWIKKPETYPISAKRHSVEYLREIPHLRPRTNFMGAITRIRHTLGQAIHRFFYKNDYFWIATPLITSSNTEGAGEMFQVSTLLKNNNFFNNNKVDYNKDFFGKKAFLTVSGQLNGEAYASALSKIYTFGPVFRAENSNTSRHLAEFWMIEPEEAFADLNDIILLAKNLLNYSFEIILKERLDEMEYFSKFVEKKAISRLENFILKDFNQINYSDAINILIKSGKNFKEKISWGMDFMSEHERFLTEEYFASPIVIKNYPKNIKAFYMRLNQDNNTVASMDILFPGIGEIIGGSQREERLSFLDMRIKDFGLNKKDYDWYRDLRKYGTVIHSGFGLGFERLISYITGVKNIKDTIPFPRSSRNINF